MNKREQLVGEIKKLEKMSRFFFLQAGVLLVISWEFIRFMAPEDQEVSAFKLVFMVTVIITGFVTMYVAKLCKLLIDAIELVD